MPTRVIGSDKIQRRLKKLSKTVDDLDDKTVYKVTGEVRNRIIKRTKTGRDVDMKPFKDYSKSYKKVRAKAGKKSGRPNLIWTFAMLGNMTFKKIREGAMIYFSSTAENNKAVQNQKLREFFGLSIKDVRFIMKEMHKPIVKVLK